MDLLCNAYSNVSDEDEDERKLLNQPSLKRMRSENLSSFQQIKPSSLYFKYNTSDVQKETPIAGRYVSKRERAMSATPLAVSDSELSSTVITSPGNISDCDIRSDILSILRSKGKASTHLDKTPKSLSIALNGHTKAVNAIQWSPTHAHLLASAGMDHTICIWNVWNKSQQKACVFNNHTSAVKDLRWSKQGLSLLSCGYDCSSRLIDVEKGIETQTFKEDQVVGVIKFHRENPNLFLSGGSKGLIRLWDIRIGKIVQEYVRGLGPILDVDFSIDCKHFISSSDISRSNISENSIIVWDVSRQVPLSNQVYVEAYTCPCIKYHPFDPLFVAQSNGNYIAIFSSKPPFRLDKYKRYEKHGVSGFPIKCHFSSDGERLVSGSSDGSIYIYNYKSGELVKKRKAYEQACIDVAFHPCIPNVIASCSWSGDVSVFE